SLDTTFDTDGKVFSSAGSKIQSLLIDSDGKILVAGLGTGGGVLVRYNADGSLDNSFDTDGIVSGQLGLGSDEDYSVALDADSKILLAGKTRDSTDGEFALARYTSAGVLDTTFSGTPTFTEGGTAVVLDDALRVYDDDLAGAGTYTGASLTIAGTDGANAVDTFSFAAAGASFIVNGNDLQFGGATFATITTNSAGTLTITFGGAATPTQALVNNVLQHVTYQNSSDAPLTPVGLTWTFNDGTANVTTTTTTVNITAVADTPVINSNGGGNTAAINAAENQTAVTTITATDADGTTPTYSISGGDDQAKFTIDTNSGVLTFIAAPDFETPTDSNADNAYLVTVTATDSALSDTQDLTVTVTNENDNTPNITSNGGNNTAANQTAVTTITATDADGTTPTYSISGGADQAKFVINATSGVLTFNSAPDFENPTDSGTNNIYEVTVTATDGTLTDTQDLTVTVTNVAEYVPPPYVPPPNQPPTILA
ncbi:cadherin repeat domain-containing protein, partial [Chromatium okenii]|uniref:cadherin repeat domain-containing protein n=1 Tax=Chromatium okenii TaxID=61644 RepID=UPI0026EFF147